MKFSARERWLGSAAGFFTSTGVMLREKLRYFTETGSGVRA